MPSHDIFSVQLSAIDPDNEIYYVVAANVTPGVTQVIGLELGSGKQVSAVSIPGAFYEYDGCGPTVAFDAKSGALIAMGQYTRRYDQMQAAVVSIHPLTGDVRQIATWTTSSAQVGLATATIVNGTFFTEVSINDTTRIYGIDIVTGNITAKINYPDTEIDTMAYDPVTDKIVGFGIAKPKRPPPHPVNCSSSTRNTCGPNPAGAQNKTACDELKCCWDPPNNWCFNNIPIPDPVWTVVELDTQTQKCRELCSVEHTRVERSRFGGYEPAAAFDYNKRVLYGVLEQAGGDPNDPPSAVVGVDLATCDTIVTKIGCKSALGDCPRQLEYLPSTGLQ